MKALLSVAILLLSICISKNATANFMAYTLGENHPPLRISVNSNQEPKVIFSSSSFILKEVYPNPINDFAIFHYNIINQNTSAKLVIHNVLGTIVSEHTLPVMETRFKIDTESFNSGVYFYTLYINGEGVLTHKLIIRK